MVRAQRNVVPGALTAAIGGLLAVIGSVLPWANVNVNILTFKYSQSVKGLDASDGKITLIAGLVALAAGVVILLARLTSGGRLGAAIVAIIAGLAAAGVALYDVFDINNKANDLANIGSQVQSNPQLQNLFKNAIDISVSYGIFIVIVGGVVALVGGIMALRAREETPVAAGYVTPPPPPQPAP